MVQILLARKEVFHWTFTGHWMWQKIKKSRCWFSGSLTTRLCFLLVVSMWHNSDRTFMPTWNLWIILQKMKKIKQKKNNGSPKTVHLCTSSEDSMTSTKKSFYYKTRHRNAMFNRLMCSSSRQEPRINYFFALKTNKFSKYLEKRFAFTCGKKQSNLALFFWIFF